MNLSDQDECTSAEYQMGDDKGGRVVTEEEMMNKLVYDKCTPVRYQMSDDKGSGVVKIRGGF